MFHSVGAAAFLIPAIIYLIIVGFVIWLIMRLIRSNERIASNTEKIANALIDRNEIERGRME
jgi:flagellar biogenesis protein FliO